MTLNDQPGAKASQHRPGLAHTDPEMHEIFERFANDHVLRRSELKPGLRLLVQLASMISSRATNEFRDHVEAALDTGVTPIELKEVVYQAVPYVGMSTVHDFIDVLNEVLTGRGVTLPLPGQSSTTSENREEKGLLVQKRVVGGEVIDKLYATSPADLLHIQQYLSAHCFGDHFSRTGIDEKTRELLILAMLVSLGGCEGQVKAHVTANLNVGNSRAILIDVLTQLLPYIGYPRTLNGLRSVDEITSS
jgi:4-carboxymuconolactone decarboxylase